MREDSTAVVEGGKNATTTYKAEEAEALGSWEVDPVRGMEGSVWPWQGHSDCGCSPNANTSSEASSDDPYQMVDASVDSNMPWGQDCKSMGRAVAEVSREAYMPRPIAAMHVRQGDKVTEAKVWSLEAHMFLLLRLRRKEPLLRFVWLSSETQVAHRGKGATRGGGGGRGWAW